MKKHSWVAHHRSCHFRRLNLEPLEQRLLLASDFGDAPAPYRVLLADDGARHAAIGPQLGAGRDAEANGVESAAADADDNTGFDDEDGVAFSSLWVGSINATATVAVVGAPDGARVDAWIDFDGDGNWGGNGERILANAFVQNGLNLLRISIPNTAQSGVTFARFRLSSAGDLGFIGESLDGEVEDIALTILPPSTGVGLYSEPRRVLMGPYQWVTDLDTADFDGDGDPDVVVAANGVKWVENEAGSYAASVPTVVDSWSDAVVVGDLDHDGDPDLVTNSSGLYRKLQWHRNDGAGNFTSFELGMGVDTFFRGSAVELADFDQDGDLDVIVPHYSQFRWFENKGDEPFVEHASRYGSDTRGIQVVDMDRDGDLDIVEVTGLNVWFENNGTDHFDEHKFSAGLDEIEGQYVVDIDGDGYLDIAGTEEYRNVFAWFRNNGNGKFSARYTGLWINARTLSIADMDGDGITDIIGTVSGSSQRDRSGIWLKNDGAGNFVRRAIPTNSALYAEGLAHAADMDGDGDMDFIGTSDLFGDEIALSWVEQVGSGVSVEVSPTSVPETGGAGLAYTFRRSHATAASMSVEFVVSGSAVYPTDYVVSGAASFTRNGGRIQFLPGLDVAQLIVTPLADGLLESSETISIRLIAGDDFVPIERGAAIGIITDDEPGDFGDAPSDYATLLSQDGARHRPTGPKLGDARDQEANGQPTTNSSGDNSGGQADEDGVSFGIVRIGQLGAVATVMVSDAPAGARLDGWLDFNGDGYWDSATERIATSVLVHNGTNAIRFDVSGEARVGATYARFRLSTAGRLSPTGAASDGEVEDYLVTIENTLGGAFALQRQRFDGGDVDFEAVVTADLDRDGDIDFVAISEDRDADTFLVWHENTGNHSYAEHVLDDEQTMEKVWLADVDGDDDLDILAAPSDSRINFYENQGAGNFVRMEIDTEIWGVYFDAVVPGDVDGDGVAELVIGGGGGGGNDFQIAWLQRDGVGGYSVEEVTDESGNVKALDAADLDGDGDLDFIAGATTWYNGIYWLENDGLGGFENHLVSAGVSPSDVRIIDMDHDGDLDLFGAGWDGLYWFENDGSEQFTLRRISSIGIAAAAIADYDGDGDLDIAAIVDRPTDVRLHQNDGQNSFVRYVVDTGPFFGSEIDIADVDGDGRLDIATGGGYWYRNAVPLEGDYNGNGIVDNSDYTLWRDSHGATGRLPYSGADGNGDGRVDQADYEVWKANFGRTVEAGSQFASQVPQQEAGGVGSLAVESQMQQGEGGEDATGLMGSNRPLASSGTRAARWWRGMGLLGLEENFDRTQMRPPSAQEGGCPGGQIGRVQVAAWQRDLALLAWRNSWGARPVGSRRDLAAESTVERYSRGGSETDWVFEQLGHEKLSINE